MVHALRWGPVLLVPYAFFGVPRGWKVEETSPQNSCTPRVAHRDLSTITVASQVAGSNKKISYVRRFSGSEALLIHA